MECTLWHWPAAAWTITIVSYKSHMRSNQSWPDAHLVTRYTLMFLSVSFILIPSHPCMTSSTENNICPACTRTCLPTALTCRNPSLDLTSILGTYSVVTLPAHLRFRFWFGAMCLRDNATHAHTLNMMARRGCSASNELNLLKLFPRKTTAVNIHSASFLRRWTPWGSEQQRRMRGMLDARQCHTSVHGYCQYESVCYDH